MMGTSADLAPVLHRTIGRIDFRVDDVEPPKERLPTVDAATRIAEQVATPVLVFSHEGERLAVADGSRNALVVAVFHAYRDHRPLVLTPDAIRLTIAQGFANHVRRHA